MIFRVRWQKRGGHIHTRVFSAPTRDGTFAKLGDLTFDERDWDGFRLQIGAGWQFVNEDDDLKIVETVPCQPVRPSLVGPDN